MLDSRNQMRWYVNRAGETTGPFEEREVAELIAGGMADADVRDEQGGAWMSLDKSPFRRLLKTAERSESFGYALVAAPASFGILVFAYGAFAGSSSGTEYVILGAYLAAIVLTTVLAVVEARQLGMGERDKGISPQGWTIFHLLGWAVAYPVYLHARSKFGRQKLIVWA